MLPGHPTYGGRVATTALTASNGRHRPRPVAAANAQVTAIAVGAPIVDIIIVAEAATANRTQVDDHQAAFSRSSHLARSGSQASATTGNNITGIKSAIPQRAHQAQGAPCPRPGRH